MPDPVQLNAEYFTAIKNKGLWPNLKILPDGSIGAFIYNQPSHGYDCGNIELHVSNDAGTSWRFRSQVSEHEDEPLHVRMNHAIGINARGHVIAIISGWSEGRKEPVLSPQICISQDCGSTWKRSIWQIDNDPGFVPFGDIVTDEENALKCAFYARKSPECSADFYISQSTDGGQSWQQPESMLPECGEVTLLKTTQNKWFAVGRDVSRKVKYSNMIAAPDPLLLFTSESGREWRKDQVLTLPGQIPGHILELSDGRLLVTYGSRVTGLCGVQAMISNDGGRTWSIPVLLINYNGPSDCGYPSTVELADGSLVTAFYAGSNNDARLTGLPLHPEYHMGILRWQANIFLSEHKES